MQTCCDYHGMPCNQGANCPAGQRPERLFDVRVMRPGLPAIHFTHRAHHSIDVVLFAHDQHGLDCKIEVKAK